VPEKDKRAAAKRACRYFELACEYAKTLPPAMLVITCGLSGTGKSTVARELAKPLRAKVITSDVVRKKLLGIAPTKRATEAFGGGVFRRMTKRT
jgi:2-phosphoglycerate kinase